MLIDKVTIKISSGRGGNGACTFLQEKFLAFGGPDGGDGGNGGNVYLEADPDMSTLLDFRYQSVFKAEDGQKGSRTNKTGKSGKDLIIYLPLGTVVRDPNANLTIADLSKAGQKVLVAKGGRGGRGNARFKSNKMRVPNFCEPGESCIERELELELKLIADLGIIGLPNAGKSTFISKISAAKPKIADYAFTTISPNLGVVARSDGNSYTVADIPGLIEGAGEGRGLGLDFLRHIERSKILVHLVDVWGFMATNIDEYTSKNFEDPLNNFIQVNYELSRYSSKLNSKKQIIVLNKIESYPQDELQKLINKFEEYTGLKFNSDADLRAESNFVGLFAISSLSFEGVQNLLYFIEKILDQLPNTEDEIIIDEDFVAINNDDSEFTVRRENLSETTFRWNISCGKLERLMKVTDLTNLDSLQHLFFVLKGLGLINYLNKQGAKENDLINIDGVDFEITDSILISH